MAFTGLSNPFLPALLPSLPKPLHPFCLKQPGAQRGVNGGQKEGPLHISQGPERQAWMLQELRNSLLANVGRRQSSQSHWCRSDGAGSKEKEKISKLR